MIHTYIHDNNASMSFFSAIACPKVPKEHEKLTTESGSVNCFDNTIKVGETCRFHCPSGYQITGSKSLLCKKDVGAIGKWFSAAPQGYVSPNCSGKTL